MSGDSIQSKVIRAVEEAFSCCAIPVLGGWFALVDESDFDLVCNHLWSLSKGYAITNLQKGDAVRRTITMHRLILNPSPRLEIDHANRLKLDNRRANLRLCDGQQNRFNLPLRRDNTTGFKGVYRRRNKWRAQVSAGNKHHYLGCFDTPEDAARAYDAKAIELFGAYACLNFPRESYGS